MMPREGKMNRARNADLSFAVAFLALALAPVSAKANSGDFNGGVAIGSSYAGVDAAPTDGLIVQGNVGIGTTSPISGTALMVNGAADANSLMLNALQVPLPAGGRLTLTSNTPVMTADVTGATTLYYADYNSDLVPVYNGTNWVEYSLSGQLSLALDSNSAHTGYQQSGNNFDLFVGLNSGTLELCTGPAWSSNSSRGTGAGTTQLQMLNGIWTNENSMTCRFGNSSSNTFTCAANQCTFVGSMRATANGQSTVKCIPSAAAGGTAPVIGISNAYNQVPISCIDMDSTNPWTYAASAFRAANNSTSNSIGWISALAQGPIVLSYTNTNSNSTVGNITYIGVSQIDNSASVSRDALMSAPTGTTADNWQQSSINFSSYPVLGYHTYYAVESCGGGTCSYGLGAASMVFTMNTTY
jgi:hypothetical protein